jgi:hypothetical protein
MHDETEEIAYCETCGGNIHSDCMKKWEEQQQDDDSDSEMEVTCPLCRSPWDTSNNRTVKCPNLDAESFSMYFEWIYTKNISIDGNDKNSHHIFCELFKAWDFGRRVKDEKFLTAILYVTVEIMQDSKKWPGPISTTQLYASTSVDCRLRKLIVSLNATVAKMDHFEAYWHLYPAAFQKDLSIAMMQKRGSSVFSEVIERLRTVIEADGEDF